jgi:hypothetical protein
MLTSSEGFLGHLTDLAQNMLKRKKECRSTWRGACASDTESFNQNMAIPFLRVIQTLGKRQTSHAAERHHLMLTGMSQSLFLNHWGEPDTQISLKKLASLNGRRTLYLAVNSEDEADYSVWIYKNKDRILFFTKKRLIIHFKWSRLEGQSERLDGRINIHSTRMASAFLGQTLRLVA